MPDTILYWKHFFHTCPRAEIQISKMLQNARLCCNLFADELLTHMTTTCTKLELAASIIVAGNMVFTSCRSRLICSLLLLILMLMLAIVPPLLTLFGVILFSLSSFSNSPSACCSESLEMEASMADEALRLSKRAMF